MGNSSTKESRGASARADGSQAWEPANDTDQTNPLDARTTRPSVSHASRSVRGSRQDTSIFGLGGAGANDLPILDARRETKQEREARKAEKERLLRAAERESSLREEGVDGGFLVTLGTYTGPEDFSKAGVRQLMIERRIAPFWRGLNDHSESWTQHQLVAAARGLPIPAPDDIPTEEPAGNPGTPQAMLVERSATPIYSSFAQAPNISTSHPTLSRLGGGSSSAPSSTPSSLFRGRSKTLASITSMRNTPPAEVLPTEAQLPHEPYVNGQPIEAVLYKDAAECPICFLYYPPYLNRTRCCDQPICSECFVQIKRPDPHPPEHADPSVPASEPISVEEAEQLVSEPATCPFCVQPEFGATYEPPPFRRGLVYLSQGRSQPFTKGSSAMSSSASLSSGGLTDVLSVPSRRRGQSLSANAPTVVTTDKVRPDWAKKLSDARSYAARKAAAATALHTAAFMMGGPAGAGPSFGRRRRGLLGMDSPSGMSRSGSVPNLPEGLSIPNMDVLLAALEASGANRLRTNGDLFPGRGSSRQNRAQDLEEVMLMEAIRLSLAAEEDRRKKAEKEADAESKKDLKKKAKEQKQADKAAKKSGFHSPNLSQEGIFASSPERSTLAGLSLNGAGKGKAKAVDAFSSSTFQAGSARSTESLTYGGSPQHHLEQSRAVLDNSMQNKSPAQSTVDIPNHSRVRGLSAASSTNSSFTDSPTNARGRSQDTTSGSEPMFNFGSLASMMDNEHEDETVAGATETHRSPKRANDNREAMDVPSIPHTSAYEEPKGFVANTSSHDEPLRKQASH